MSTFEGHEKYMTQEPATQPFASRHNAESVSTKTQLPPGHEPFAKNERGPSKTKRPFLKKIGD